MTLERKQDIERLLEIEKDIESGFNINDSLNDNLESEI
jgi:hypothetical protein